MSSAKIIAVIGAPRSGKTFLVNKLASGLGYTPFLEGQNDTFPDFIKSDIQTNENSLRRILWFRNKEITHFLEAQELRRAGKGAVLDTFFADNQMYLDVLLSGHDRDVAYEMMQLDLRNLAWPDVVIYLKNNESRTKEFLKLGGRDFDAHEDYFDSYIVPLQAKYEKILTMVPSTSKLIIVDRSEMDFDTEEDLGLLLNQINQ
jgi:deoxyadenosine/deoxycytidine kinase